MGFSLPQKHGERRENENSISEALESKLVSFNARAYMFVFEYMLYFGIGIGIGMKFDNSIVNSGTFFFLIPCLGILILPLFLKGRSILMMLYGMKIVSIENQHPVSMKKLIYRKLLFILYIIPLVTIFWMLIRRNSNPWYDEKLKIKMIWPKTRKFNRDDWIKKN